MVSFANKQTVVIGLGASGLAACDLLNRRGAVVLGVDEARTPELTRGVQGLVGRGVEVLLGVSEIPDRDYDLAVVSPGVPTSSPLFDRLRAKGVPIIGELELGYQNSLCLNIAITGTNGKTTTTELAGRMLADRGLKTRVAGNIGVPLCSVVDGTRELDFLTLEVSSFQLETTQFFRPAVAVLLNLSADHLDRYASKADYVRAKARLFMNQQSFDWAIVQSEALAELRAMNLKIPAKVITFSASNRRADLYLNRGLLISRIEGWSGPLLDLDKCNVHGPHNAENLMAALALGRVLRIPLDMMVESLGSYSLPPHRCEEAGTVAGVRYINDSKSTNLDSLSKALLSIPARTGGEPNVWLIAGGKDKGFDYHDIGPQLSQRVKGAFLIGEAREKIRAAWSLFTPCAFSDSLLEAVAAAARAAEDGDVVLLSPACSSFDQFKNYQHRGEVFMRAVKDLPSERKESVRVTGSDRGSIRWKAEKRAVKLGSDDGESRSGVAGSSSKSSAKSELK